MGIEGQRAATATYLWVAVAILVAVVVFIGLTGDCVQEAGCEISGPGDTTCAPGPCDIEQRNHTILLGVAAANLVIAAVAAVIIRRKR